MTEIFPCLVVSGGGTTMEKILNEARDGTLKGLVAPKLVVATRPGIGAINKALAAGMPKEDVLVIRRRDFADEDAFGRKFVEECDKRGVNFVGLYGCLTRIPRNVIERFAGMLVNQHPGPLSPEAPPGFDFGGKGMYSMRVHATRVCFTQTLQRDPWSIATTHRVLPDVDRGEIVGEKMVPVYFRDTPELLQKRMLPHEHTLQIAVLRDFAIGIVKHIKHSPHWLVKPEERELLERCKQRAIELYPNG